MCAPQSLCLRVVVSMKPLPVILILIFCMFGINNAEFNITWIHETDCSISNTRSSNNTEWNEFVTIHGQGTTECAIQISPTAPNTTYVLQIVNGSIDFTDFIYFIPLSQQDLEKKQYTTIDINSSPYCNISFSDAIQLYFLGKFDVKITTVLPNLLQNDDELTLQTPRDSNHSSCTLLTNYDYVIDNCLDEGFGVECNLQCPTNCSCILGDREVISQCDPQPVRRGFITYLPDISSLNFAYQNLTGVQPCSFCAIGKYVQYLDLHGNKFTAIKTGYFSGLPNVIWIDISNNSLTTLDVDIFNETENLQTLVLNNNLLVHIPELFFPLTNLNWLELKNNQISSLQAATFNGLKLLTRLELSSNKLTSLKTHCFQGLESLTDLLLGHNQLYKLNSDVFKELHKLKVLDLVDNNLTMIPSGLLEPMKDTLTALNFADNHLETLPINLFCNLSELIMIDLSNNNLQSLPRLGHLPKLALARLHNNGLHDVNQKSFQNLSKAARLIVDDPIICQCLLPNDSYKCAAQNAASPYLTCERLLAEPSLNHIAICLGFGAISGNLFVIWWRGTKKYENKIQSLLLANLAISDLLMGIYLLIIASADIYFGDDFPLQSESWRTGTTCRFAGALAIISSEASVFFIMLISIDRFIGVKYPYSTHKLGKRSTVVTVSVMWTTAVIIAITASILTKKNETFYEISHVCIGLPLAPIKPNITNDAKTQELFNNYNKIEYQLDLDYFDYDYLNYFFMDYLEKFHVTTPGTQISGLYFANAVFLGLNLLCFLIVLFCYTGILWSVYQTSRRSSRTQEMDEQIRLTIKVIAIVGTDCLCWFPIIVMGILVQGKVVEISSTVFAWTVTLILPINSTINPFLYTLTTVLFKRFKWRKGGRMRRASHQLQLILGYLQDDACPEDNIQTEENPEHFQMKELS